MGRDARPGRRRRADGGRTTRPSPPRRRRLAAPAATAAARAGRCDRDAALTRASFCRGGMPGCDRDAALHGACLLRRGGTRGCYGPARGLPVARAAGRQATGGLACSQPRRIADLEPLEGVGEPVVGLAQRLLERLATEPAAPDHRGDGRDVVALRLDEGGVDGPSVPRDDDGALAGLVEVRGEGVGPVEGPAVATERRVCALLDEVAEEDRVGVGHDDGDVSVGVAATGIRHRDDAVAEVDRRVAAEGAVGCAHERREHVGGVLRRVAQLGRRSGVGPEERLDPLGVGREGAPDVVVGVHGGRLEGGVAEGVVEVHVAC